MFLAAATGAGGSSSMIIILLLFFVLMWFFMIRPEKKKQKKIEAMRSALSVGDENDITIETGEDKVRVQFKKWAVSSNVRADAAEAKEKEKK